MAKLAGILVEGRPQEGWAVLGIGLNVAVRLEQLPAELRPGAPGARGCAAGLPAATLGLEPADVEPTLARLLDALERRLARAGRDDARGMARARRAARARDRVGRRGAGARRASTDHAGRLVVALADGGRTSLPAPARSTCAEID